MLGYQKNNILVGSLHMWNQIYLNHSNYLDLSEIFVKAVLLPIFLGCILDAKRFTTHFPGLLSLLLPNKALMEGFGFGFIFTPLTHCLGLSLFVQKKGLKTPTLQSWYKNISWEEHCEIPNTAANIQYIFPHFSPLPSCPINYLPLSLKNKILKIEKGLLISKIPESPGNWDSNAFLLVTEPWVWKKSIIVPSRQKLGKGVLCWIRGCFVK